MPIGPFFAKLEALKQIGQHRRVHRSGFDPRRGRRRGQPAGDADELQKMRALVEQGMRDGAFGLSTGLFYVPGAFTPTDEVVELAKVAGRLGGMHISHMRDETSTCPRQRQRDDCHRRARRPADADHAPQDHRQAELGEERRNAAARRRGACARRRRVDRRISLYRVEHQHSGRAASGMGAGRRAQAVCRRGWPTRRSRAKVKAEAVRVINNERGGGDPKNIVLASCDWDASLAGKNLADVTRATRSRADSRERC